MKKGLNVDLIVDFIKEKNLSKKEFCKKCGISNYIFQQIIVKQKSVGLRYLIKIKNFMNTTYESLLDW